MPSLLRRFRTVRSLLFAYPKMALQKLDYDEYWDQRRPGGVHPRYRLMGDIIEAGSSVLDLGCGDGALLAYLVETLQVESMGVDLSSQAVDRARNRGVQARVADIARADFCPSQPYDYILLSEVLEHLTDPEELLLRLKGIARKGLLVSIPNSGFWPYRLRLLFGRFPVQWAFHAGEHLRFWTVTDFVWWSRALGYRVKAIYASNGSSPLGLALFRWRPTLFGFQVLFWLTEDGPRQADDRMGQNAAHLVSPHAHHGGPQPLDSPG
jgi:methionine biosynthesis protein MetW